MPLTHPALVWTRPWCVGVQYSLKNWGTDRPRNSESPVMMRFLIEFMFVNWRKDNPTEAERNSQENVCEMKWKQLKWEWDTSLFRFCSHTHETKENTVQCSKYREGYGCKDGSEFTCKSIKIKLSSWMRTTIIRPIEISF